MRERILYGEKYRKGALRILPDKLPTLHHLTDGYAVHSADLLEAGRMECRDGVVREFQVIRVLLDEKARPDGSDDTPAADAETAER
jgi:hypothetical protein